MSNTPIRIGRPQSAAERTMQHALDHPKVLTEMARCLFFSVAGVGGLVETCVAWERLSDEDREGWRDRAVARMREFAIREGPDTDPDDDPDPGATRPNELELGSVRAA